MRELLKFEADWCSPCKQLTKAIEGVDLGILITKINVDTDTATPTKYAIRGVPTLVLLEDGREVKRVSGFKNLETLKKWLEN